MKLLAPLALATVLAATAIAHSSAQTTPQFTDPANLRGERVSPRTGRELPIDLGASGLQQLLRKLNTRASLLLIVAHPDDEDGGMLTLYSRGLGARVGTLTLNRGEGGQNAMTGDFEDALGLIRTQELLSADRYLGVDTQMFGTEVDFGFSKTKEEAFAKWTHERVLYDAVRAIRLFRPMVIASVFIGGVTDGHGQHQVSGQIAQEAFRAAADPTVFPDMIREGILPWQALKIYARVPQQSISAQGLFDYATGQYTAPRFTNYVTGEVTTTTPSVDVVVHEGTTDPLLTYAGASPADLRIRQSETGTAKPPDSTHPLSYVQFARIGLGLQRTQIGPGVRLAPQGVFDIGYHLYGPAPGLNPHASAAQRTPALSPALANQPTFFDGIDTSILSLQTYRTFPTDLIPKLAGDINSATTNFDPAHPERIAPTLADALKLTDDLIHRTEQSDAPELEKANALHELRLKQVQLQQALTLSLDITLSVATETGAPATAPIISAPSGSHLGVELHLSRALDPDVRLLHIDMSYQPLENMHLSNQKLNKPVTETIDTDLKLGPGGEEPSNRNWTAPYFTRPDTEQPFYNLVVPSLRNAPAKAPVISEFAHLRYHDVVFTTGISADPPIALTPPVTVQLLARATALPLGQRSFPVTVFLQGSGPPSSSSVHLELPPDWSAVPATTDVKLRNSTDIEQVTFRVTPAAVAAEGCYIVKAVASLNGKRYSEGFRPVGYPGIPYTTYFTPATVRIVPVDLQLPPANRRRIAYLPGTGDAVPEALASIGLAPTILTAADLTPSKLSQFDTVILGVRTYNAHPDLHGAPTQALLDFARSGGNVVVQYQTYEFTAADAPYPLSLGSNEKVVDETAPVRLLSANAPLLTTPNLITPADFNNWVEERGHGFLGSWDPRYTALTETHDPGGPETAPQSPQQGGLITTPLGKGRWTYCAFALYRQLPEAVPGGFRLFVNLLTP